MNLFMIIYRGLNHYIKVSAYCVFLTVTSFLILLSNIGFSAEIVYNYDKSILYLCAAILFIIVLVLVIAYNMGYRKVVMIVNLMRKYKNQLSYAFVIVSYFSTFGTLLLAILLQY